MTEGKQIGSLTRFEHDLGHGWIMVQIVDSQGIEQMVFINEENSERIILTNESVKRLRDIIKK